jgi:hypothetical protein
MKKTERKELSALQRAFTKLTKNVVIADDARVLLGSVTFDKCSGY